MKNVQIPEWLFLELCKHHLDGIEGNEEKIKLGLANKRDKIFARNDYIEKHKELWKKKEDKLPWED